MPLTIIKSTLLLCALCIAFITNAQTVGLVLSGGGATGMVHIGVLKALEENNVPIDYITGTSMGALIGALYAAGYSPNQIDSMFRTEQFQIMAEGGIEPQFEHFFQKEDKDASLISLKFFTDTAITTSLPTNFRDPTLLDLELMLGFAGAQTVSNGNLDSLFVPFRCVAADLEIKGPVIFREGDLAQAVRASMSYPFYFKPIKVNGHIMLDGGLYNNFPADVMLDEFKPDFIIGSNVSYNDPPPSEDDIISQMKAMVMERTEYSINTENGIIIEPGSEVGRFDFDLSEQALQDGYSATMLLIDSIKTAIGREVAQDKVLEKRASFNAKMPKLLFGKVAVNGLNRSQNSYMDRLLDPKKGKELDRQFLKKKYFRAYADKNIKELYPTAVYDPTLKSYRLDVLAKRERDMEVQFGGVFSSKPINTGYVGLKYRLFEKASSIVAVNSYFGKFYGSLQGRIRIDLSTGIPIYIEPQVTQSRWDYFKSFSTFFEEVRPSFIVQKELHGGINNGYSLGSKGELRFDIKYAQLRDEYYQTDDFNNTDTVDVTTFYNGNVGLMLERNSLDRKEYASAGEWLSLSVRYVNGSERNIPGSTAEHKDEFNADHEWLQLKLVIDKYFSRRSAFKFGFHLSGVYSNQPFFNNYTATIIRAPAFEPIPEARTRVMPQFRAHQYLAGGLRSIIRIKKVFDIRLEGFIFQPVESIKKNDENQAEYGKAFSDQYYIASGTAVWHSPLGPVAFSINYLDQEQDPWSVIFSFGYIIFNQKALN